jgi:osmotically-inducible protein OsmY
MKKFFVQASLAAVLLLGVGVQSCKNKKSTDTTTTTTTTTPMETPVDTAPVTVNDDATIRSSVDAVIKQYPNVTADVQNGKVTLRGTVNSRDEMQKIVMAVNEAKISNFENQITVKK